MGIGEEKQEREMKPNKTYTDTIMELLDYLSRQKDKKAAELYQKVGKLWDMIEEDKSKVVKKTVNHIFDEIEELRKKWLK